MSNYEKILKEQEVLRQMYHTHTNIIVIKIPGKISQNSSPKVPHTPYNWLIKIKLN